MNIADVIIAVKNNLQAKMPAFLKRHGIKDFDMYGIGYPTDQNKIFCAVRLNSGSKSDFNTLIFTVHLSIVGIEEEIAYKYIDAISDYLNEFESSKYGFMKKFYNFELLENFRTADTQVFFDVTMTNPLCDEEM